MASLTGTTVEGILGELKGRIYYNPETDGYEVADKFIAGNVIGKAERIVPLFQAAQNGDGVLYRGFIHHHRLEPALQRLSLIHI